MTNSDMDLVREYASHHSEQAFAALVARHVNLVYSVALHQLHDASLAEEVTQAAFIILARKAGSLGSKTILSAWLCRTAQYLAANALRTECRRQCREQEAYMQSNFDQHEPETSAWTDIAPLLNAAMAELGEKYHSAIVLRYLEGKDLKQVGAELGIDERTAQTRVRRALEKLRKFFLRRGISSTAAIIAGAISANAVQAAPATVAKTATAVALGKGVAASGSTLTLIKGALQLMAWSKAKTAIIVGVGVLLASGTTTAVIYHRDIAYQFELAGARRAVKHHIVAPVDMVDFYTAPASAFPTFTRFPAWGAVPIGFQVFDHIPLNIGGQLNLWGGGMSKAHAEFPEQKLGLEVKKKFETLYVYHGAFYDSKPGTPVYSVVFNYSDGSAATNYVRAGDDLLDWVANSGKKVLGPTGPNSKLAWVGGFFSAKRPFPVRFTLTAINNPNPELEVSTMDLYSCKSYSTPVIMAMTVGKAGLMKGD